MNTTQNTTPQNLLDARNAVKDELDTLDALLFPTFKIDPKEFAKQAEKVADAAHTLKALARRFEEGI